MNSNELQDELFTESQTAEYLNIKRQTLTVWRSTKRYALPFVRVGRSIRYRRRDLELFLTARTVGGAQASGEPNENSVTHDLTRAEL